MPVKIPLDKICVRTGVLCPRCQRLVNSGEYSPLEVEIMKILLEVEDKLKDVDLRFVHAKRMGSRIVVIVDTNKMELPAWLGRHLSDRLGESVVVLPRKAGLQELVEYAVRPFMIIETSRYYAPDGNEYLIIKLPRRAEGQLDPGLVDVVTRIARERYKVILMIRYVDTKEELETEKIKIDDLRRLLSRIDRY